MKNTWAARLGLAVAGVALLATVLRADRDNRNERLEENDAAIRDHAAKLVRDGREIFRFDTFGSEAFWGGALRLHQTIAGSANGGVGAGVSPLTAHSRAQDRRGRIAAGCRKRCQARLGKT